jgi:hypothetical protein
VDYLIYWQSNFWKCATKNITNLSYKR